MYVPMDVKLYQTTNRWLHAGGREHSKRGLIPAIKTYELEYLYFQHNLSTLTYCIPAHDPIYIRGDHCYSQSQIQSFVNSRRCVIWEIETVLGNNTTVSITNISNCYFYLPTIQQLIQRWLPTNSELCSYAASVSLGRWVCLLLTCRGVWVSLFVPCLFEAGQSFRLLDLQFLHLVDDILNILVSHSEKLPFKK